MYGNHHKVYIYVLVVCSVSTLMATELA